MKAGLIALNLMVLAGLAALTAYWPPAGFLFLFVGPLSLLGHRKTVEAALEPMGAQSEATLGALPAAAHPIQRQPA